MVSRCSAIVLVCLFVNTIHTEAALNVVWSVNAGGEKHIDIHGVRYSRDTANFGEASDYGKTLLIGRVHPQDQILYQTERYHTDDFSYEIPIRDDGDYVLVLKFSEVWFNAANQKIFNVKLDDYHEIVTDLDIYKSVGRGVAHDEIIPFKVKSKKLIINGRKSDIQGGSVTLTMVKGFNDNPKLNAAYLAKATVADIPMLPPLHQPEPEEMDEEEEDEPMAQQRQQPRQEEKQRKHTSGPKVQDPYAMSDSTSYIIPIIGAVAAFIPLLYCLCKI